MTQPINHDVFETPEIIHAKTAALGKIIQDWTMEEPGREITRLAFIPRGGLFPANIISRMLGLSGDQLLSIGITRYGLDDPTMGSEFKYGQMPVRTDVEGHLTLLVDEVIDSARTMVEGERILLSLGATTVLKAATHYKPEMNETELVPDFYVDPNNGWIHYPWEPLDDQAVYYRAALRQLNN